MRPADVADLQKLFVRGIAKSRGQGSLSLTPEAVLQLESYSFPGNIKVRITTLCCTLFAFLVSSAWTCEQSSCQGSEGDRKLPCLSSAGEARGLMQHASRVIGASCYALVDQAIMRCWTKLSRCCSYYGILCKGAHRQINLTRDRWCSETSVSVCNYPYSYGAVCIPKSLAIVMQGIAQSMLSSCNVVAVTLAKSEYNM